MGYSSDEFLACDARYQHAAATGNRHRPGLYLPPEKPFVIPLDVIAFCGGAVAVFVAVCLAYWGVVTLARHLG